ncbi:MAG: PaaI family thioesterase [Alphaproteobacteria bacterium]|nr:PaaI family thioesterase [Alphaproteobacteria bacterium]
MSEPIPEGFVPHFKKSGLTDPWEPLYSRQTEAAVEIGFRAGPAHANSRGFVHGGLLTALADNAMGLSCVAQIAIAGAPSGHEKAQKPPERAQASLSRFVTVGLSVDFIASAQLGQWIEIRPAVLKAGPGLCFSIATIHADGALCARANATFRATKPEVP